MSETKVINGKFSKKKRGKGQVLSLKRSKDDVVEDKWEGRKSFVEVSVSKGGRTRRAGRMFLKELILPEQRVGLPEQTDAKSVMEKYRRLVRIFQRAVRDSTFDYVPLPKTLRVSGNMVLMSDVTEGGKKIIIDNKKDMEEAGVDIVNIDEVKDEIRKIADIAFDGGVFLGLDSFSVVVDRETNEGKISLEDFGTGMYLLGDEHDVPSSHYYDRKISRRAAGRFIQYSGLE